MDFKGGLTDKLLSQCNSFHLPAINVNCLGAANPNVTPQNFDSVNVSDHESFTTYRPLPKFFTEQATFSTKKEKETPKLREVHPPKPPIKSCPPISRIRPSKLDREGARVISFVSNRKDQHNNGSVLTSKYYDIKKKELFFEQCFIIEGSLGDGSFGKVYKVISREDGKLYAVKQSKEKFKGEIDRLRKLEEVAKHQMLPPHPSLVRFYRAWEEKHRLYIQIELCHTSLSSYAETHHNIPEEIIWQFLVDLLSAVKHLHDRKLCHMDIKPENIFISHHGFCKLGDFGLVIDLNRNDLREVQEGDPKYLAPEVLLSYGNITCAADIFSLGMTILELATDLDLPRGGDPWHQLRNGQIPPQITSSLSKELLDIIMRMIEPNHMKRATVDELLSIARVKSVLRKRKMKYLVTSALGYFRHVTQQLNRIALTIWYFVMRPLNKAKSFLQTLSGFLPSFTRDTTIMINGRRFSENGDHLNTEGEESLRQTSTPKRTAAFNIPIITMQVDEEDAHHHATFYNDSFSTYNNSYGHQIIDSSSSFSDTSDCSIPKNRLNIHRKSRTAPPNNNKLANGRFLEVPENLDHRFSPSRTPPSCRPLPSSLANSACKETTPSKMVEPARQKLNFDDNDEDELDKENKQQQQQQQSLQPPPQMQSNSSPYQLNTSGLLKLNDSRGEASLRSAMPLHRVNARSRTPSPAVVTFNGGRELLRRELYGESQGSRRRRPSRARRSNMAEGGFAHRASPLLN